MTRPLPGHRGRTYRNPDARALDLQRQRDRERLMRVRVGTQDNSGGSRRLPCWDPDEADHAEDDS